MSDSSVWFVMFYAATMIIFTMYGGGFATIPAYLADLFGSKFVGAIHGRLLTAWATAGVLGPVAIARFREDYLLARIERAQIASLALLADDAMMIDDALEQELLGIIADQVRATRPTAAELCWLRLR